MSAREARASRLARGGGLGLRPDRHPSTNSQPEAFHAFARKTNMTSKKDLWQKAYIYRVFSHRSRKGQGGALGEGLARPSGRAEATRELGPGTGRRRHQSVNKVTSDGTDTFIPFPCASNNPNAREA